LFATTLGPNVRPNASPNVRANVNDGKVQHKYYNETNETIDSSGITSSFEDNYNSNSDSNSGATKADNRLKLFKHNEPEAGLTVRTPPSQINANISNSYKSWPKLAANVELDEKSNESYKSINTYGLVNENIASVTSNESTAPSPPTTPMPTESSIGWTQNTDNMLRIKYIDNSVEKHNIDSTIRISEGSYTTSLTGLTAQSLTTSTHRSLIESNISSSSDPSIDAIISTTTSSSQTDQRATYTTYLTSTAGAPTQSPTPHVSPTAPVGIDIDWSDENETDFMINETKSLLSLSRFSATTQVILSHLFRCDN
jgi:hypothetical protein